MKNYMQEHKQKQKKCSELSCRVAVRFALGNMSQEHLCMAGYGRLADMTYPASLWSLCTMGRGGAGHGR